MTWTDSLEPDFGEALRRLREGRGLSQSEVARRFGSDHSLISKWESGQRGVGGRITLRSLAKMADALDLTEREWRELVDAAAGRGR